MDLGRMDLVLRTGLGRELLRRRWRPVVGSATLRFRRGLAPFARYELATRLVGWDEKWLFLEQRFERGGELCARGFVKALFRGPDGSVPSAELVAALGVTSPSPELPEGLHQWMEAERSLDQTAS
jgi:acyl-CoA thioesterase FadM